MGFQVYGKAQVKLVQWHEANELRVFRIVDWSFVLISQNVHLSVRVILILVIWFLWLTQHLLQKFRAEGFERCRDVNNLTAHANLFRLLEVLNKDF